MGVFALGGCVIGEHALGKHGAVHGGHRVKGVNQEHAGTAKGSEEESGNLLTLDEIHDVVWLGAKLTLEYSVQDNAFVGTV